MVDKDMKEIAAIREIFPDADVLLCWFHVLQVHEIYNYIPKLKHYETWKGHQGTDSLRYLKHLHVTILQHFHT